MTKDEFLYDHDEKSIADLINRERYLMEDYRSYEKETKVDTNVYKAGDIL